MTTDRVVSVLRSMAGKERLMMPATDEEKRWVCEIGAAAVRVCSARRFRRRLRTPGERLIVATALSKLESEFDAAVREANQAGRGDQ